MVARWLWLVGETTVSTRGNFYPAGHSRTEPNVIGVGAVGVANVDNSGEGADERSEWSGTGSVALLDASGRCDSARDMANEASNCGTQIQIAAPGEDVYALSKSNVNQSPQFEAYVNFTGTSAAAPVLSGVAAILQAIRPTTGPLPPVRLKNLLIATATTSRPSGGRTIPWFVSMRWKRSRPC